MSSLDPILDNYHLSKFDKRLDLPFFYAQYIVFHSNRSIKQSYGIVISQTIPIMYLSSDVSSMARKIHILMTSLERNGFYHKRLLESITRFLSTNSSPRVRFDVNSLIGVLRYHNSYMLCYFIMLLDLKTLKL